MTSVTIHRYTLNASPVNGRITSLKIENLNRLLHVGPNARGEISLWCEVLTHDSAPSTSVEILLAWTGDEVDVSKFTYGQTFAHDGLVWHAYVRAERK